MKRALVLAFCFVAVHPTLAQVSVQVADYPVRVFSYSPVFITGVVENHGSEPVFLPASFATENRYFIETGSTKENLKEFMPFRFDGGGDAVWVRPGESWFFQMEIGRWWLKLSGPLVIRVGMRSTGRCFYYPRGDEEFPLKLLNKNGAHGDPVYECWHGHVVSDPVTIDFVEPDSAVDRAALDYIRSPEFPYSCNLEYDNGCLRYGGAAQLLERFPSSHYTYASMFPGGSTTSPEYLQKLLDLQPSHPLTPYTRFMKALATIRSGPDDQVTLAALQALDIPSALKDYLLQERAGYEKRQKRAASQRIPPLPK